MSEFVTVKRELLQNAANAVEYLALRGDDIGESNVPIAEELRAVLAQEAGPVCERQEPGYVLARQTAVDVPGQERKELGYTLFDGIGVFRSREEVHAAIAERGLPIGWVSMTVDQLLPGYMMPKDTSPPAPVSVVMPERKSEQPEDYKAMTQLRYSEGWNACLDKVKELNQ